MTSSIDPIDLVLFKTYFKRKGIVNYLEMQKNSIDISLELTDSLFCVDQEAIRRIVKIITKSLRIEEFELSITITDDQQIKELNCLHRNIDLPTDVLSFPQQVWDAPILTSSSEPSVDYPKIHDHYSLLGDVVISLDSAEKNSRLIGHSLGREFCFLLVHGVLHLCGHDHQEKDEQQIMFREQKIIMDLLLNDKEGKSLWKKCIIKKIEETNDY